MHVVLNYYNTHIQIQYCFMSDNRLLNVATKTNFSHFKLHSRCSSSCHVAKHCTRKSLICARSASHSFKLRAQAIMSEP